MADFKKVKSRNIRKRRKSSDNESESEEEEQVMYVLLLYMISDIVFPTAKKYELLIVIHTTNWHSK